MGKEKYLQHFRARLNELYLQIRDYDNKDIAMAQGVVAFMEAGIVSGVVIKSELEAVIHDEHQQVFGVSREQRIQEAVEEAIEKGDYAYFDTPSWERH